MATIQEAIKRLIYQFTSTGADKVAADLGKVAAEQEKVAVSAEKTSKSSLDLTKSFDNLERRFDSTIRAQQDYQKVQDKVNAAVAQHPELQDRANNVLAKASDYFDKAKGAATGFNAVLDAGRGAALGYAAGIGPIGAVLGSFGPWGIAAAAGIGLVVNALDYMNKKADEIGTESSGLKQFADTTGLTVTQVRGLTEAGAELGISSDTVSSSIQKFTANLDEARKGGGALFEQVQAIDSQLANDLASTRSQAEALDLLTKAYNSTTDATTKAAIAKAAFGKSGVAFGPVLGVVGDVGGVDAYSAATQKALGVTDEWTNKVAALRNENRSLESDLKLINASAYTAETLERQNSFLRTEISIAKAVRDRAEAAKAYFKSGNSGPQTDELGNAFDFSLLNANKAATQAADSPAAGATEANSSGAVAAIDAEKKATEGLTAARLEAAKAEEAAASQSGNLVSMLGGAATGAEIAEARFHKLTAAFLENKFGASDSAEALEKYQRALSGDTANQVAALQEQRAVIEATGGAMKMAAQYAADYAAGLRSGKEPADALQIAAEKLANSQAAAKESVDKQIEALKDSTDLIKAQQRGTEASTSAAIAYRNAMRDTGDQTKASALATETMRNALARSAASTGKIAQDMQAAAQAAIATANAWEQSYTLTSGKGTTASQSGAGGSGDAAAFGGPTTGSFTSTGSSAFYKHGGGGNTIGPQLGDYMFAANQSKLAAQKADPSYWSGLLAKQTDAIIAAGGSVLSAISSAQSLAVPAAGQANQISTVQSLYDLLNKQTPDKTAQASNLQQELAWLNTLPQTLATQSKIADLTSSINSLTSSTDSLNSTMGDALSPYYSQDPRTSHLGFRAPGMATGGEFTVPGGYSANDNMTANIPVASGEVVSVRRPWDKESGGSKQTVHINQTFHFNGNVNRDEVGRTAYQAAQSGARQLQAANR